MRTSSVLLSAFHFILASLLLMAGILSLGLGKVPHMKLALWRFLDSNPDVFSLIGTALIVVGSVLFVSMFAIYKKVFYQVKMNASIASVDPLLIESYVKACWKEILPGPVPYCEVLIRKDQKIEILTKLSLTTMEEHEKVLSQMEKKLCELLKQKLGYKDEFFLTASVE